MRSFKTLAQGLILLALSSLPVLADTVDTIKAKGVLTLGVVIDPPFGIKNKDGSISGYDVEFGFAIAKKLGVKPEVLELEAEDRFKALASRRIDILTAVTKNAEREKTMTFSNGYFVTGQKFVARVGKIKTAEDAAAMTIGVVRGTTSEKIVKQELPKAMVVSFGDIDEAFGFLAQGKLDAVSYDEPILAAKLFAMPSKRNFEIAPVSLSTKAYGFAVPKGERRIVDLMNDVLGEMERSGEAERIFDRWFGPNSKAPMMRVFRI